METNPATLLWAAATLGGLFVATGLWVGMRYLRQGIKALDDGIKLKQEAIDEVAMWRRALQAEMSGTRPELLAAVELSRQVMMYCLQEGSIESVRGADINFRKVMHEQFGEGHA